MKNKDTNFIEQLNLKDKQALRVFYEKYYAYMTSFAMNYCTSRDEAEDIVQNVFISVWEKELCFESIGKFITFLYTSIRNSAINQSKHKKVEEKYEKYIQYTETLSQEELIEEEVYLQLFRVIDTLPKRCREILELHMQDKKNEEIAEILSLSVLTVKTQKAKAMQILRKELGSLYYVLIFWEII
ncbi:MAG: RNA polymerase sigma-70 factor [Odoribacter sp.]